MEAAGESAKQPGTGRKGRDPEAVRERILSAFAERAMGAGIRSVAMGELARHLRMSATTLYRHFPSKDDLVTAVVERWASELAQTEVALPGPDRPNDPTLALLHWAEAWSASLARFCPAFWQDLRRDHPAAYDVFRRILAERKRLGAAQLRPHLRPDVDAGVALEMLNILLEQMPSPQRCERLGVSRRHAIAQSLALWARGALNPSPAR